MGWVASSLPLLAMTGYAKFFIQKRRLSVKLAFMVPKNIIPLIPREHSYGY